MIAIDTNISNPIGELQAAIAGVWRLSSAEKISEVLRENYVLSFDTEADPGRYNLEENPYWKEPIDLCNDSSCERISILKSTQVGGTITCQGAMIALAKLDPAPGMVVFPTQDEAIKQRDRIYGNALASLAPFSNLVPPPRLWNTRAIHLGGSEINIAWSGSPQRLRGKPCKRVYLTEIDVYEFDSDAGDPLKSAAERTKQFYRKLIFEESTPVGEESAIYRSWEQSQQRRYHCPCPHCGTYQELRFFPFKSGKLVGRGGVSGIHDAEGNLVEPDVAETSAFYVCINGCRIDQNFKASMVSKGVWVAKGQSIDAAGQVSGEPVRDSKHVGFHIWTIMQSKISVGKLARAYIEHFNDNKLRDFWQNWLGLRYQVSKKIPDFHVVGRKFTSNYVSCEASSEIWFLTAGADVQLDQVYWVVVGWGPQRTPYLVDWGEIHRDRNEVDPDISTDDEQDLEIQIGSDLEKLPEVVLHRTWPVVGGRNPFGKTELAVRLLNCDTNYRTGQVHSLARSIDSPRFRCVRGEDMDRPKEPFRMTRVDRNARTGQAYEGGLELWSVYKTFYQDWITDRLISAPGQAASYRFPKDITTRGRKLLRQICNVRKGPKGYYETVSRSIGRDFRDCLGHAEAAADMVVGNMGWDLETWLKWRQLLLDKKKRDEDRTRTGGRITERHQQQSILER